MLFALYSALDSRIVDFADFLRVKARPFLIIERLVEPFDVFHAHEIDERITNVAVVEKVHWQVEEIKLIFELLIERNQHLLLRVLVGDVSDHKSGPSLLENPLAGNLEALVVSDPLTLLSEVVQVLRVLL